MPILPRSRLLVSTIGSGAIVHRNSGLLVSREVPGLKFGQVRIVRTLHILLFHDQKRRSIIVSCYNIHPS